MGKVFEGNEANFAELVTDSEIPVLVDFWATWCGYCTRLSPVLDDLAADMAGKVKVVKVNVDENRTITDRFGVRSLPTMILFKGNEQVEKLTGFMPKETIAAKITPLL